MSAVMLVIVGLCAGWLAGQITDRPRPPLENLVIGVIGAAIGGILFRMAGVSAFGLVGSLVSATVGSIVLLFAMRSIR
jgi:uncharacterized membrane protein YeaQ/YmgE (transglycosylase-associated protein family)